MIILLYRVSWKWTSKKTGKILKIIKSWRATAFLKIYKKLKRMSKNENRIHLIHAKSPRTYSTGASSLTGNNLSSQAASSPVLSTRESLTAVFGMGTGGSSQPSSPDRWMVFSGFCFVSLRLARSIYASIISRRSPCLPCITPENPHSFFRSSQTFKTLQKKLLTC